MNTQFERLIMIDDFQHAKSTEFSSGIVVLLTRYLFLNPSIISDLIY
jgi:hypothetical protein